MNRKLILTVLTLPAAALAFSLSGCVDEKIVYKDRELYEQPPTAAAGFLGYSKVEEKLTVCGNCHMGAQAKWQETVHAGAWEGLHSSDHAAETCEGCHSVNELGNYVEVLAGYNATKDPRYEDVQCEACHGPGLEHVSDPSKGTAETVLAPVNAGLDLKTGCIECHNGTHHPYGEEWAQSAHGNSPENEHPATNPSCQECHVGEGALEHFGVTSVYKEKEEYEASLEENLPITCAVCHDPHDAHNTAQLRFSISEADVTKNLCMKCHYKRGFPDPTTYRGPHSPEGPLLEGDGGWWGSVMEATYPTGRVEATHGSSANPLLCAGCHMNRFNYKDDTGTTINGVGHTFQARPCLDANGAPIVKGTCADAERTYQACTTSGCHGSEGAARSAVTTAQLRIANLVTQLDVVLQQVDANWKNCRRSVPPAAGACNGGTGMFNGKPTFNTADAVYSTAEGAGFNYDMGARVTAVIHNPLLVEALLLTSIQQVKQDYGVTTPNVVDLTPQFKRH